MGAAAGISADQDPAAQGCYATGPYRRAVTSAIRLVQRTVAHCQ